MQNIIDLEKLAYLVLINSFRWVRTMYPCTRVAMAISTEQKVNKRPKQTKREILIVS